MDGADRFPQDVVELLGYLGRGRPGAAVRAIPGEGTGVPVWILGSSLVRGAARGAPRAALCLRLALRAGRPRAGDRRLPRDVPAVAVARGAAADAGDQRLRRRQRRRGAAAALVAACRPSSTCAPATRGRCRGRSRTSRRRLDPMALAMAERALVCSAVGAPETVRRQIAAFVERHRAGRADPDRADPRPRGAAALVRDRRRGAGRGSARPGVGGEAGAQRVAAAGGEQHVVDAGGAVGAPGPRRDTRSSPAPPGWPRRISTMRGVAGDRLADRHLVGVGLEQDARPAASAGLAAAAAMSAASWSESSGRRPGRSPISVSRQNSVPRSSQLYFCREAAPAGAAARATSEGGRGEAHLRALRSRRVRGRAAAACRRRRAGGQVAGRVLRPQVAPALEGAARLRQGADERRVEPDARSG